LWKYLLNNKMVGTQTAAQYPALARLYVSSPAQSFAPGLTGLYTIIRRMLQQLKLLSALQNRATDLLFCNDRCYFNLYQ